MIKLFVSDLDGTLLYNEGKMTHSVSKKNREAILRLKDSGVHFAIATGRSVDFLWKIFEDETLFYDTIGFGGNIIRYNHDIIDQCVFNDDELLNIFNVLSRYKNQCSFSFVDQNNDFLSFYKNAEMIDYFSHSKRKQHLSDINEFIDKDILTFIKEDHVSPCRVVVDCINLENVELLKAIVKKEMPQYTPIMSSPKSMELMKNGINKASGIRVLARYFNVNDDEIAVIGDSENDAAMIDEFDCSFKMNHGCEKLNANHSVDYVYEAIEKVLEMNQLKKA